MASMSQIRTCVCQHSTNTGTLQKVRHLPGAKNQNNLGKPRLFRAVIVLFTQTEFVEDFFVRVEVCVLEVL